MPRFDLGRTVTAAEAGLTPIPADDLPRMVGKQIHLRNAPRGCVWRLLRIDGDTLHLMTPVTKRERTARAADACYTRGHDPKEASRAS